MQEDIAEIPQKKSNKSVNILDKEKQSQQQLQEHLLGGVTITTKNDEREDYISSRNARRV